MQKEAIVNHFKVLAHYSLEKTEQIQAKTPLAGQRFEPMLLGSNFLWNSSELYLYRYEVNLGGVSDKICCGLILAMLSTSFTLLIRNTNACNN